MIVSVSIITRMLNFIAITEIICVVQLKNGYFIKTVYACMLQKQIKHANYFFSRFWFICYFWKIRQNLKVLNLKTPYMKLHYDTAHTVNWSKTMKAASLSNIIGFCLKICKKLGPIFIGSWHNGGHWRHSTSHIWLQI